MLASFPSHKWHKYALGPFNSASLRELAPGTSDVSSSRTPLAIQQLAAHNFFLFFLKVESSRERLHKQQADSMSA